MLLAAMTGKAAKSGKTEWADSTDEARNTFQAIVADLKLFQRIFLRRKHKRVAKKVRNVYVYDPNSEK